MTHHRPITTADAGSQEQDAPTTRAMREPHEEISGSRFVGGSEAKTGRFWPPERAASDGRQTKRRPAPSLLHECHVQTIAHRVHRNT
ncbi:hypothetical protein B296_00023654 [Ensete ventricosum]|uniref:Uncharacterized protein n=1 Tax=Ensete ventricosum TaxID=4639 RepID=A0A426ZEH3_ENSVE|nr:hypothetical protein B296_00023654 [Ensete ventricosum]